MTPAAAVSYITDDSGRLLVVWNRRYNGWSLPGGMVEPGESIQQAQARELREETGLETLAATLVYDAPAELNPSVPGRGRHVYVFAVLAQGVPRSVEPGCPVTWMTRAEFLHGSPFASFYVTFFAKRPMLRSLGIVAP